MKKIALIEPYFSGSHKDFALGLKKFSNHEIEIFSMEGRHWKWRMHGGAVTLAKQYMESEFKAEVILSTSLLDLTTFLSLTRRKTAHLPIIYYFHESQFTYPLSHKDTDRKNNRDNHYGFINIASALAADKVLFNSQFHLKSFLKEGHSFLKQLRDYPIVDSMEKISNKAQVIPVGIDFELINSLKRPKFKNETPLIIWNHRWEYDKNFSEFLVIILEVKKKCHFKLAILGESFKNSPPEFQKARDLLEDNLTHFGHINDKKDYINWLWSADIALTTSNHDFFGISVVETLFTGCLPILPNRLSYPEHIKGETALYNNKEEAIEMLIMALNDYPQIDPPENHVLDYSWSNVIKEYDELFERIPNV